MKRSSIKSPPRPRPTGTATDLRQYVGRTGLLTVRLSQRSMAFPVRVLDARVAWGALQYLIMPVGACGNAWVSADRVELE